MLSSAKKSVPTLKQFLQPYFIETAPDGAITAACPRFTNLLQKNNIYNYLEKSIIEVFRQLGTPDAGLDPSGLSRAVLPISWDLRIDGNGLRPMIIRWTPTPANDPEGGGWQFTGVRIYPDGPSTSHSAHSLSGGKSEEAVTTIRKKPAELRKSIAEAEVFQTTAIKYSSDVIISADPHYRVTHWNKAAEKFYGISARQAIGRKVQELTDQVFTGQKPEELDRILCEQGYWEGEATHLSANGKRAYLFCHIRQIRVSRGQLAGIVILHRDQTEDRRAQDEIIRLKKLVDGTNRERKLSEEQLNRYSGQITNILESITDGFFVLDKNFCVEWWNREAERITGLSAAEMVGASIWERMPEMVGTEAWLAFHKALKKKVTVHFEQLNERFDRWLESSAYPSAQGLFVYFKDITVRKKGEAMLSLEKKVLELNSNKKTSLPAIVTYFLKGVEKIFPEMYCSVLTLDDDGISVRHLSSPRLPAIYTHAIDGLPIGPAAGSCGTAMYRKESVIVSDIATDPLWAGARDLAMQFGLRASWSLPVLNAKGEVLAAFASYYKSPKSPTDIEMDIVERATNLVRIILENDVAEEEIRISNQRYMLATRAANDAIWDWDINTGQYFWGEGFYQQFGYRPGTKVRTRKFWESHVHPDDKARIMIGLSTFIQCRDKGLWLEEYRFKRSDGKYALVSDRGYLVLGKEDKPIRMVGSMQDITEKREMETRLLKQELSKQKLIAQAMVDAQEKERAEIGKELHDNINQILSTTKLYLELARHDNKERMNLIRRSAENIHEAIHEIRNISRSLVPSSIDDLGLIASISDLVESVRTTRAIHVEFYPVGNFDEKISDKEKLMLFRIIQEQVNNVLKHSAAKNLIIELILEEIENRIELTITDDGRGFLQEKVKNKKGLGLSNIMSRADLFGGKVTIMSAPGQGCKLRVQVPVI